MNKMLFTILPLTLFLVACNNEPSPVADAASPNAPAKADSPSSVTETAPRTAVAPTRFIHADPAELPNCDVTKVTLKWDVSAAEPSVAVVEIYAGSATEMKGLFVAGGGTGQKETGPWVRPGSNFSIRDKSTGTELERLVIGGPICP